MRELYGLLERVAQAQAPVLIRGESGTGKELVARALHSRGRARAAPFVAVNCTALPETLLETELFGHVRGAFTGATDGATRAVRRGRRRHAASSTRSATCRRRCRPSCCACSRRARCAPSAPTLARRVDVRVVAATHQDLEERVRAGAFRDDLYYRLNVVPIRVPPLRERVEDIPLLAEHFLAQARARNATSPVARLEPQALAALSRWSWPGNVRELENLIERLVVIGMDEVVQAADVKALLPAASSDTPIDEAKRALVSLKQLEREYITWVVAQCNGNKTKAAEILGIDVSTIHRR